MKTGDGQSLVLGKLYRVKYPHHVLQAVKNHKYDDYETDQPIKWISLLEGDIVVFLPGHHFNTGGRVLSLYGEKLCFVDPLKLEEASE